MCRQDSLRSIIVSQRLLATNEIAVVQHTDCGMLTFKNPDLQGQLAQAHPEHKHEIESIDFLPIPNLEQGVRDDVQWLKSHPLVLKESVVTGWVYDVKNGKVRPRSPLSARVKLMRVCRFRRSRNV